MSGPGTFNGPRRYLEWAKPFDLFLQYQQYAESIGEPAAAFSTFSRVLKSVFKSHLRFRDKGEHAQCDVCWKLRVRIKKARTKEEKTAATQMYSKHLLSQWLDRQQYWSIRALSRHFFSQSLHFTRKYLQTDLRSSILCLIQDGMDQAKLRVPRFGYNRISKAVEKLYRPALHLVGSWIHGWKLNIAISDEDVKKNSETSIEMIVLSLSDLLASSTSLPLSFHLQHDNTYREGKNRFMLNFLLLLVILGIFRVTSMGFLRTSHSHEDIDQCFGQIARLLMGKRCCSAKEMVTLIADATMNSRNNGEHHGRIRGSLVESFKLDEVTAWKEFVAQTGLRFKGLRRVHYFRFCMRKDLGSDILDNVAEIEELHHRHRPHEEDVFLITKRWLSDAEVMRAIALVPAARAQEIRRGFHPPAGISSRRVISDQVKKVISKRVPPLERKGELTAEAANYLLHWSTGRLQRNPKPVVYPLLAYRYSRQLQSEAHAAGAWNVPRRVAHFDLSLDDQDDRGNDSDSSSANEAVDVPPGFDLD